MRIVLDHCVDWRLARLIQNHEVVMARRMGWDRLRNGDFVAAAEAEGFDLILTVDKNLRYQQNLADRKISLVVLEPRLVELPHLAPLVPALMRALDRIEPGAFVVIGPDGENGYT